MLFQFDITGINWMVGIALIFGLAYIMYYLTTSDDDEGDLREFLIWIVVFNGLVVYGGLVPLWTLILSIVVVSIVLYVKRGG